MAYLSLTPATVGQNGIGPELHEALGVLRNEELLAAARVDGANPVLHPRLRLGIQARARRRPSAHWAAREVLRRTWWG